MSKLFARFVKDESGATAIEYGLIAALIALAIMVGAGALGNALNDQFGTIATKLNTATAVISTQLWLSQEGRRDRRPSCLGSDALSIWEQGVLKCPSSSQLS